MSVPSLCRNFFKLAPFCTYLHVHVAEPSLFGLYVIKRAVCYNHGMPLCLYSIYQHLHSTYSRYWLSAVHCYVTQLHTWRCSSSVYYLCHFGLDAHPVSVYILSVGLLAMVFGSGDSTSTFLAYRDNYTVALMSVSTCVLYIHVYSGSSVQR